MNWLHLISLAVGIIIGLYTESYANRIVYLRTEAKRIDLALATDITLYRMMEASDYSAAMSCVKVPLATNVRTYQYYKDHVPQFGESNPSLERLVKQAIEIVPGAKGNEWPIPGIPTIMSATNAPSDLPK